MKSVFSTFKIYFFSTCVTVLKMAILMLEQDKQNDEKIGSDKIATISKTENCEKDEIPNEDILTSIVGEFGRFQLLNLFLMGLSTIMVGSNNFVTKFLAHEVDYWCSMVNKAFCSISLGL